MVELLLSHGADPFITDLNGDSCFHVAASNADHKVMKILCSWYTQSTVKDRDRLLNQQNFEGMHVSWLRFLMWLVTLAVNHRFCLATGLSALHSAVLSRSSDCGNELLRVGASAGVGHRGSGRTPLHLAVAHNDVIMCFALITEV